MPLDTVLAVMVALIFASGLLFAAYLGADALRAKWSRRAGADELERKATTLTRWVGLVLGALFIAGALVVMMWLIPR